MTTIVDALETAAARHPDRPALVEGSTSISYGEVARRVRRAAGALRAAGIEPGMRAGVALDDDAHHVVMLFALAHLGAIVVPIDWRLPAADATTQMARFGAKVLLAPRKRAMAPGNESVVVDADWWGRADEAAPFADSPATPERPFLVALSSGSTGAPDGRLLTHGNVVARLAEYRSCPGFDPGSTFFSAAAISQASGRAYALYTLMMGNTLMLYPSLFGAGEIVEALNRSRAEQFFAVPTVIRWLLGMAAGPRPLLPHLRFFETTGAPLHKDEKLAARSTVSPALTEIYASASTGNLTRLHADAFDEKAETVGRPVPGARVDVVDESGRSRAAGEAGEIRMRGPGCAFESALAGAFDAAERTESVRDGWVYPGEIGSFDEDGYLRLVGRVSEFVLRNGVNVYPQEIEAILQEHPAVREAAVFGVPSEDHGEALAAAIVANGDVSAEILASHCRGRLAGYKLPDRIEILRDFPRTLSGKIDKLELRALFQRG